eukprot:2481532-Pyramimonas_sp.AAC.1
MSTSIECSICQEPLATESQTWRWGCLHCARVACMAKYVATAFPSIDQLPMTVPGVPCPLCRSPWSEQFNDMLWAKFRINNINLQEYRSDAAADSSDDVDVVPATPSMIVPLCCTRLFYVEEDGIFQERQYDRRMTWTGATSTSSRNWECLRCNST